MRFASSLCIISNFDVCKHGRLQSYACRGATPPKPKQKRRCTSGLRTARKETPEKTALVKRGPKTTGAAKVGKKTTSEAKRGQKQKQVVLEETARPAKVGKARRGTAKIVKARPAKAATAIGTAKGRTKARRAKAKAKAKARKVRPGRNSGKASGLDMSFFDDMDDMELTSDMELDDMELTSALKISNFDDASDTDIEAGELDACLFLDDGAEPPLLTIMKRMIQQLSNQHCGVLLENWRAMCAASEKEALGVGSGCTGSGMDWLTVKMVTEARAFKLNLCIGRVP